MLTQKTLMNDANMGSVFISEKSNMDCRDISSLINASSTPIALRVSMYVKMYKRSHSVLFSKYGFFLVTEKPLKRL